MTLIPFLFIWVSYLPVLAHKLLHNSTYKTCCRQNNVVNHIAVISYFLPKKYITCSQQKSLFDFCFDLGSLTALIACYKINSFEPTWNLLFISAMLLVIYTDTKTLLISNFTSIYLVPVGILLSTCNQTNITTTSSVTGALFGFFILFIPNYIFKKIYKQDGIGSGDFDLLACIGSFTGPLGVWSSLSLGSITGTISIGTYQLLFQHKIKHIPLGSFLAFGAILFTLHPQLFVKFFLS